MKFRERAIVQWSAFAWGENHYFKAGQGVYLRQWAQSAGFSVVRRHNGTELVIPTCALRKRRGGMAS